MRYFTPELPRSLFLLAFFLFLSNYAYSQSKTITGNIVDETGMGVIGANVYVK